jgi:hypothetical protein
MQSSAVLGVVLLIGFVPAAAEGPTMNHKIDVPAKFRSGKTDTTAGFGWDISDIARYVEGYERYWWHCAETRARNIEAECEFFCSGNLPATAGCSDGAFAANSRINANIRKFGKSRVQRQLRESVGVTE